MFLFERLVGLLTYIFLLMMICFLIVKLNRKYLSKIIFLYVLLLSTISFFYIPTVGADLYRIRPLLQIWGQLSFSDFISEMLGSTTPIYILYMHLIGRTNIEGLLPAITCFLFYNNIFYIIKKYSNRYNISSKDVALTILFVMSIGSLIEVISGIRTMLAFSFIARCCYDEMVEGKKIWKNLIVYILASLLHSTALILTIIRIASLLVEKNKNLVQLIAKVLFLFFIIIIGYKYGYAYVDRSIQKAMFYISKGDFSYFWEYLIGFISLILIIKMEIMTFRLIKIENNSGEITNLLRFCIMLSFILILFSIEYNTFHRFGIFLHILSVPMLLNLLNTSYISNVTKSKFRKMVLSISLILLFIACARGNLTSFKFFIL